MSDERETAGKTGSGAKAQERRTMPRYQFSASAEAVHIQANTRLSGRVSDLSRGGCYVDTISPFPSGAEIKIRIVRDNQSFVALGQVLYSSVGFGMGIAFTKIDAEKQGVLDAWLAELSGEAPRELRALDDDLEMRTEAAATGSEAQFVLNELIVTLMWKNVLTEREGKAMLKKLLS
jgi:hypothetical protein